MLYAEVQDVEAGFRALSRDEQTQCAALLSEAAVIIDSYNPDAGKDAKRVVSCRMVRRQLGESDSGGGVSFPVGSTQGTATALGYSQSWTMSGGSSGELYLSKLEKKLLGVGSRIGARSSPGGGWPIRWPSQRAMPTAGRMQRWSFSVRPSAPAAALRRALRT